MDDWDKLDWILALQVLTLLVAVIAAALAASARKEAADARKWVMDPPGPAGGSHRTGGTY